jgi:hypothetical protein
MDHLVKALGRDRQLDISKGSRILALLANYWRPMRHNIRLAIIHTTKTSQPPVAHLARKSELSAILDSRTFDTKRTQLDALWLAEPYVLLYKESGRERGPELGANISPGRLGFCDCATNIFAYFTVHGASLESRY